MRTIKQQCPRCYGEGKTLEDLGGPFGSIVHCAKCDGYGRIYITIEQAQEILEAMKEDLSEQLDEILKLERDIKNVDND